MIGARRRGRGSLLDNGPETLTVQARRQVEDSLGAARWVDDGPPVPAVGYMVQPVTSAEANDLGLEAIESYRVIGRGPWPGGMHSVITWDGRTWDQRGPARRHRSGLATHHVVVIITSRSPGAGVR